MTRTVLLALLVLATACGDDDGGGDTADAPEPSPPECHSIPLSNSTAAEKVNAGLCFGLGFRSRPALSCGFNSSTNETRCVAPGFDYTVRFSADQFGDVFDTVSAEYLGRIVQGATGAYEIVTAGGQEASCAVVGDVATFCLFPER